MISRDNPIYHDTIIPGDAEALTATRFNPSRPTVIYLFGFSEAVTGASTTMLKNGKVGVWYRILDILKNVLLMNRLIHKREIEEE